MDTPHIANVSGQCFNYVRVFSEGMWNVKPGEVILKHSLVRFHLQLLAMFLLATLFHLLLRRFHFSRFTSDILAGLVLGRTVMGHYKSTKSEILFPPLPNHVIVSLSKIGYMFFVFLAGVQMDTTLLSKTGRKALSLGILVFVTNFAMVLFMDVHFRKDNLLPNTIKVGLKNFQLMYFGSMTQTEFVGVSHLLMQLKIINSQLGRLALAASMQSKLMSLGLAILKGFGEGVNISIIVGVRLIVFTLLFILFIVIILRKMVFIFIKRTPEGQPMKEIYAIITIAFVFILASSGDIVGLNYIFGPLIFGFVVPARSPLGEILIAKFNPMVSGFFLPLLTIFCASKVDLHLFISKFSSLLTFKISLIGFAIKLAVTFFGVIGCKLPLRHAVVLTIILNAKGINELGIFISFSTLEEIQVTSGIFLLFLLQAFQPLLVKILYHPAEHYVSYKEKTIQNASEDAELHILVCAHRQEDAVAAIELLENSNPTKHSPLSIYGLCLEELVSSFVPVVINHQLGQKMSSSEGSRSRSQPIIDIFKYFKSQHKKLVQVNVFTAISPFKQMHEDICWLSFDKECSLIILPYHKKWNSKGKLVSSNTDCRNLNINVLENAPCSVGILIDRKRMQGLSSIFVATTMYRVALLFVGGSDDKEAVLYALRMARSPRVHVTIINFVAHNDDIHNWENMIKDDFLRILKAEMSGHRNINFIKEKVRDGADTSAVIKSMSGGYDLIMVGSQHEAEPEALSGLSAEWIDFPELGPMGDLLASEDISQPVSILVVQQQKKKLNRGFSFKNFSVLTT